MDARDPLSRLMSRWEPKNPHALPKFVQDTVRQIRLLDQRPRWRVWADGWMERIDEWVLEWLPAPRVLLPVAASFVVLIGTVQWARLESHTQNLASLRWQQAAAQPLQPGTLSEYVLNHVDR